MKTYAVRTKCKNRFWVDITEKTHTDPHFMAEYRAQALAEEVGAVVEEYEIISATRLAAADALATAMEPLNHFLDTFKNESDNLALWFYSDGTAVVTVGDFRKVVKALTEYREAK